MNEPPPHQPPQPGEEWERNGRASDVPIEPGGDPSPFEKFPDVPLPEDEPYLDSDIDIRKVTVTFIKDETGKEMRRVDMTLLQLAEHIRFTTAASKMALPWLKLALFGNQRSEKNSLRTNENVLQVSGIEVEHDAGEIAFGTALATVLRDGGVRCILYTSPSYVPDVKERWRILLPLSKNYPPEWREKGVARVNGLFGGKLAEESFVLSQAYLYGSVNNNPDHRVEVIDGKFLDLRDDLYAGSIFKDGSRVGGNGNGVSHDANDAGSASHKSRKDDDPELVDPGKIEAALNVISSNCSYAIWLNVAAALRHALGEAGFPLFDRWSAKATGKVEDGTPRYTAAKSQERWRGARTMHSITIGTLFHYANEADSTWRDRYWLDQSIFSGKGAGASTGSYSDEFGPAQASTPPEPLQWLDMSNWDSEPIPERQWAIADRVPLNQVGLFSGEGGAGKSIIELMKNVGHVMSREWLDVRPEQGGAFYLGAEDATDELHIRLAVIARHYGVTFAELIKGGLRVLPLLGKDATLCAVNPRTGRVETTALYRQIYEAAGDLKPKNISVDTLSRAFVGNEIDRGQVYAFAMHMQALAMVASGSVTVLSHPSLAGIASGSGISGSTAWHGAFRFRQYLRGVKADSDKEENGTPEPPDNGLRTLEFKKNQYGPLGASITLKYRDGLFLPEFAPSSAEMLATAELRQRIFLELLARYAASGRNAGDKLNSPTYAPKAFAGENLAKGYGLKKNHLEEAMKDLFAAGKIKVESYGRPSQPSSRIVVATSASG